MVQNVDPAIWEAHLRQLMVDYAGVESHRDLHPDVLMTLNALGRLLACDPYAAFLEY